MRNSLLTTAVLVCLATAGMADDQKKDGDAQPKKTEQTQMARNDAHRSIDYASSVNNCWPKSGNSKSLQDNPEADPAAPQNQVEYGGGG
jgi:hypothetical protein